MIKTCKLNKIYKNKKVINSFSYEFKNKGLYVIKGESGTGKTTLLNILSQEDKIFDGNIGIETSVFYLKDKDNFISSLSLDDNFYLFELANNKKINYFFDMSDLKNKKIKHLSLGEIQLAQVILALNSDYKVIIMDEPFSALEDNNLQMCCELIEKLSKEKLVIVSMHNYEYFKNPEVIDLNRKTKYKVDKFDSYNKGVKQIMDKKYYLFYYKKCFLSKLIFLLSICFTIFSGIYCFKYSNNIADNYSSNFEVDEGVLVEKEAELQYLNDDIFYEMCKRMAKYIVNYNARYYHDSLYNYDIKVEDYYIDNGIALSSFEYIEKDLLENEIVVGFDYNLFCRNNKLFYCEEEYLKTLLINKKIDGYDLYVKDIVSSDYTSFYINERFYKVVEEVKYVEYYFDIKKENINNLFLIIKNDNLLSNFNYIKEGENDSLIRYKIELSNSQIINEFEYDNYVVCLNKGYNCLNYLNRFESLVKIDHFSNLNNIYLKTYDDKLMLNEVVISSSLSNLLSKGKGDVIEVSFEYNDFIHDFSLYVKEIIKSDNYILYQNSDWGYTFFKDVIGFSSEDLLIKNIIVYEKIRNGYRKSDDAYKKVMQEISEIFNNIKKVTTIVNIAVTLSSLIILVVLEIYNNKFKKEYFSYLKRLNIEKKNA